MSRTYLNSPDMDSRGRRADHCLVEVPDWPETDQCFTDRVKPCLCEVTVKSSCQTDRHQTRDVLRDGGYAQVKVSQDRTENSSRGVASQPEGMRIITYMLCSLNVPRILLKKKTMKDD